MTISLTTIECQAFKAFVARAAVDLAALAPGLHLVRGRNLTNDRLGSNGSGKSTLFSDAPTWCLYGRTVGGLRTTEVQSWLTDDAPQVSVTIQREDKAHVVVRGPRASDLTIDDRAVGQEDVDGLVGLDYAAWCQAVVWGQGQPLFFDLTPSAKMSLLSDALGLERWERRAQAASGRAKRLGDRLQGLEGEIRGLEAAREHAQDALGRAKDASWEWGRAQAIRIEENASATRSARSSADSLEGHRGEAAFRADSAGVAARQTRDIGENRCEEAAARRGDADRAVDGLDQLKSWAAEAEAQIIKSWTVGQCPTCGQSLSKKDAVRHGADARSRLKDLRVKLVEAETGVTRVTAAANKLDKQLATEEHKLRDLEEAQAHAEGEQRLLERELGAAQARVAAAAAELQRVEAEENPHREAAQVARAHLREVERKIKEKGELSEKLSASTERAQFWARGFREIRLGVIDDILDDLHGTTAEVLDGLGLGEWGVEYATERETKSGSMQRALTVAVRSPAAPAGVRWESYSGGERQRLRLAGALALSEVLLAHAGTTIDFRVLDEPTRGLSPEGVRDLVEVLGAYAEEAGRKIFYADHTSSEGLAFASTVETVNDEHGARVV